jgi:hypothetical protein
MPKTIRSLPLRKGFRLFVFHNKIKKALGKEVMDIPRMPKYIKREARIFLDERGRKKYDEACGIMKGAASGAFVPQ